MSKEVDIIALQVEVHELNDKISRLDQAEAAIRGESLTVFQSVKTKETKNKPLKDVPLPNMTIKQMVMQVLKDKPKGLNAHEILVEINWNFDRHLVRTSLSPQLSRLKDDGKIVARNKLWFRVDALKAEYGDAWDL